MAAAAIASGAVASPDAGVAAGVSVNAIVTGIATATALAFAVGVVTAVPSGGAEAGVVEASAWEALLEDGFSADLALSVFGALDFAGDCWPAWVLASALALEACPAAASRWSELFLAAWSPDAALRDRELSAFAAASPARPGAGGCWGATEVVPELPVLEGAPLSTSAPKLSPAGKGSGRAAFGGAV